MTTRTPPTRPRLLFLCQTMPFPPDGGVWIRTYHVLRLLSRAFDITALCFERAGSAGGREADVPAAIDALSRFATVEVFPLPQRHSRLRFLWDHARSLARRRVYTTYLYESRRFQRRLAAHLAGGAFDLVHADSLDLARYLPACSGLPIVCVHHDVESDLLARRAEVDPRAWRRAYFRFQSARMLAVERRWAGRVALNIAVSDHDRTRLRQIAPDARVAVVPNGVDLDEFQPAADPGTGLAFVGGAHPAPNRDALDFFCGKILPHLRRLSGPVPVHWIGRASAEEQQQYLERYGVTLTGYVPDVRPLMQAAACHVVPLRVGGGTRLKILNAWAMGKAVVSTSIGCEGLAAVDGDNILIRDDPQSFAAAVGTVVESETLRAQLGRRGRETASELYDWDAVGRGLIDTYLRVAIDRPGAVRTLTPRVSDAITCRQG